MYASLKKLKLILKVSSIVGLKNFWNKPILFIDLSFNLAEIKHMTFRFDIFKILKTYIRRGEGPSFLMLIQGSPLL